MDLPMIWQSLQPVLLLFLPPFFGVLTAFLIERGWNRHEDRRDRKKLHRDIRKELEVCSNLLTGEGNLLPTDIWKSIVSSGSLRLVPHDPKIELAQLYFRIENHNYEAEKVRNVSITVATTPKDERKSTEPFHMFTNAEQLHIALSNQLRDQEAILRKDIDNFLRQNIWRQD